MKLTCYSCLRLKPTLTKAIESPIEFKIEKNQALPKTITFTNYAKEAFELKENVFVCDLVWLMRLQNTDGEWLAIEKALTDFQVIENGTASGPAPFLTLTHADYLNIDSSFL